MCTHGLLDCIAGCELTEFDEVTMNDHRGFLVDLEIERCCTCGLSKCDKPNHSMLNNERKIHVEKFNEKLDEVTNSYNLKQRVVDLMNVKNEQSFNEIDDLFTKTLMKARSAVEGSTRTFPYSKKEVRSK